MTRTCSGFDGPVPPAHIVTGWYDFFLENTLDDYMRATARQPRCRLTIGPFSHWGVISIDAQRIVMRAMLSHFDEHLKGGGERQGGLPVRVAMLGDGPVQWRGFVVWPPPTTPRRFRLCAGGQLDTGIDDGEAASGNTCIGAYTYDPLNPTPALGGPSFNPFNSGAWDQRALERRGDVLVFSSPPLPADVEVLGRVELRLRVRTSGAATLRSADHVGRLCDVAPSGASINRCEGLCRVAVTDGVAVVHVDLGHVGAVFAKGHRVRVHVCGGAHPRWLRNLGSGAPVATATRHTAVCARHEVVERSELVLPVLPRQAGL